MKRYVIEKSLLDENGGNIVLGNFYFDVETDDDMSQIELTAITSKGYVSKKRITIEPAIIVDSFVECGTNYCVLDPQQIEPLVTVFDSRNQKHFTKNRPIDVTTAFGLAGTRYGWVCDRIDELG